MIIVWSTTKYRDSRAQGFRSTGSHRITRCARRYVNSKAHGRAEMAMVTNNGNRRIQQTTFAGTAPGATLPAQSENSTTLKIFVLLNSLLWMAISYLKWTKTFNSRCHHQGIDMFQGYVQCPLTGLSRPPVALMAVFSPDIFTSTFISLGLSAMGRNQKTT